MAICLDSEKAFAQKCETSDECLISNQHYLSTHYMDGTMGMVVDNTVNSVDDGINKVGYTSLQKTMVRSSGLPDEKSIVVVFLGEGFTVSEQQIFLERVTDLANYMVTVEPFNIYNNYLTVYALHSISNDSGISGELDGKFACRDNFGNPATAECTPVDSATFNCVHGRDTYYNSYYQWRSSASRVILEMSYADRARARNDALAACPSANMIQIIANSEMRGGTGQMPTKEQPLGVALTSINKANPFGDWKKVIMHEFGHAFGGLWDEYWNGIIPSEYPNMTQNNNFASVKWKQLINFKNIGVYPFAKSEWDGNPNQSINPWYRPHQNCIMRQTENPFCSVCSATLIKTIQEITGVKKFSFVNLDKAGGEEGSNGIIACEDYSMPAALAPKRKGYIFKGYFYSVQVNSTKYYDGNMNSVCTWDKNFDTTLYAHWEIDPYQTSFTVTLDSEGDIYTSKKINVVYGNVMPDVDIMAPKKTGYAFDGYYDSRGVKYYEMRVVDDRQTADIYGYQHAYVEKVFPVNGKIWDHTADTTLYARWRLLEGNVTYENVTNGKVLGSSTVRLKTGKNVITPQEISNYKFSHFIYDGRNISSNEKIGRAHV